jgi:flagellar assembly protein FliH
MEDDVRRKGDIGVKMKSSGSRIIKSEEVIFIQPSGGKPSGAHACAEESRKARLPGGAKAMHELERVKKDFTKKIHQAELEAYNKGLSDGILQGRDIQKNEALNALQSMMGIVTEASELKKNILQGAEEQILRLALAIAEKVLHLEVTANPDVIQSVLKEAIKKIVDRENMKIRVHPQDFHYMMEIKADFLQSFDGIKNIVFEKDESIRRGGAIIETLFGEVDARLEQQYSEIKALMVSSTSC